MIDHIIITVSDYEASKAFYLAALKPLGYSVVMEFGKAGGFGIDGKPDFWIREAVAVKPEVHIAFSSPDRPTVNAFYDAAIAAGGVDNGEPGLRLDYHADYYGGFVFDPDGNNIEAVCHKAF
jgi:catechol 2,3-dioxygenase-like lactoylglutathione lyase family enzyme